MSLTDKTLDYLGPAWAGCRIEGDTLITANCEAYTAHELQFLRWERNRFKSLAHELQAKLKIAGKENAIEFPIEELRTIREGLRLLDSRLPGESMQVPTNTRRHRRA